MQNKASKPAVRNHRKAIVLGSVSLLLVFCIIFLSLHYHAIRNALLRQLLSPTTYMTLIETEYLNSQSEDFEKKLAAATKKLSAHAVTGIDVSVSINQLISSYLEDELQNFKSAGLSLRHQTLLQGFGLTTALSINNEERLHINFWSDHEENQFYLQLPELSMAALSCSYSEDFLPVYLLQEAASFLHACLLSAYDQVQENPYSYLIPYLDIIETVTLDTDYTIIINEKEQTTDRLIAQLSVQKALEIASEQLEEMEETNPLLPLWHLLSGGLERLAATQDVTLVLTAYTDTTGHILGHEFALERDGKTLCSLTGLLSQDLVQGSNGTLYFSYLAENTDELCSIPLELQQFGISSESGFLTGTLLLSHPALSGVSFALDFYEENGLPKTELRIRALGFTGASVCVTLSDEPVTLPALADISDIYPPEDWDTYFSIVEPERILDLLKPLP